MLPYLNLLNSYFLAAGYETTITLIPHDKDCGMNLSETARHLGINTVLG